MRLPITRFLTALLLLAAGWGFAGPATAGELPAVHKHIPVATDAEWTELDFLRARPVQQRWRAPEEGVESQSHSTGPVMSRPPRRPTVSPTMWQAAQLADPRKLERWGRGLENRYLQPLNMGSTGIEPHNRGTAGLYYTSSRLIPTDARLFYPYVTVGKVFMMDGGDTFVCSGAVIDKRLVLTAGHCVHDGDDFLDSFRFVPAYHDGSGPTGDWQVTDVWTTGEWAAGGGNIPNVADFGILVIQDKSSGKIGSVVGTLGWMTNSLAPNDLTILGYPTNHDKGMKMHQVHSGQWEPEDAGNFIYGSDMGGGSSGGPWVQNFNVKAKGQKGGNSKKRLRVVGVTSWGFVSKKPRIQASSTLNSAFVGMRQQACSDTPGNC